MSKKYLSYVSLELWMLIYLQVITSLALNENTLLTCVFIKLNPLYVITTIIIVLYIFSSNNNDDAEMLRQMRLLYCRSNRLVRLFSKCSKTVLIELCRSFCTTFYCPYFWTQYKKATFSKLRVAYNNVYRKILGLCRRSSASEMFVTNNILNFEALIRKSIFAFTSRLSISNNAIICTIQKSWVIRETVWKSWTDKLYL